MKDRRGCQFSLKAATEDNLKRFAMRELVLQQGFLNRIEFEFNGHIQKLA